MASEVGTAYLTIIPSAKGFAAKLQGELAGEFRRALGVVPDEGERTGRSFASRFRDALGSGLRGVGSTIVTGLSVAGPAIAAALGAITVFGLKSAANMEQVRISFNALTGSVEKGGKVFADLQKFAATTPFEFSDLTATSGRFLAFADAAGLAKDQLIPFLTTIGNIASVTGGGPQALNSVSLAMGQIASSGKLTLDNLNQISEALPGFSGVAAIAAARGETTAQVMKEISAGSISGAEGIQALLKGMQQFPGAAGAMEAQSQTLLGVFSTFKDTISQALTGAFQPIIPGLKDALTQITPLLGQAIGTLAPALGGVLTSILPLVSSLVSALVPILTPLLQGLEPAIASLGSALGPLGAALGQIAQAAAPLLPILGGLIGSLVSALAPAIQALTPAITGLVQGIAPLAAALAPILASLGQQLGALIGPLAGKLGSEFALLGQSLAQVLPPLVALAGPALDALIKALPSLLQATDPLIPAVAQLAPALAELLVSLLPLAQVGADAFAAMAPFIAKFLGFLASAEIGQLTGVVIPALHGLADALNFLLAPLKGAGSAGAGIGGVFKSIGDAASSAWSAVSGFFSSIGGVISDAFSAVGSAVDATVGFFEGLPGRVVAAVSALPGELLAVFKDLTDRLLFAVGFVIGSVIGEFLRLPEQTRAVFETVKTAVVDAFTATLTFLQSLPARVGALVVSAWNTAVTATRQAWTAVRDAVSSAISAVASFLAQLPGQVAGFISDAWARGRALFSAGVDAIVGFARELPGRAAGALAGFRDSIVGAVSNAVGAFRQIGVDIMHGMIDGISSAISSVVDAVKGAVGKVIDGAKAALHINSPSKVFAEMGSYSMEGYAVGVESSANLAADAVRNALTPDLPALQALATDASLRQLNAASGAGSGDTFNLNGNPDFTIADLEAMLARRDALDRVGKAG